MSTLVPLLHDLLDQSRDWVTTRGIEIQDQEIVSGDVAWDEHCGGLLYVRLPSAIPAGETNCPTALVTFSIYIGILRCQGAKMRDDGNPPSTAEITADSLSVFTDMEQLLNFLCAFNWTAYTAKKEVVSWAAQGPQGQMMGGEWQIDVNLIPDCGC